MLARKGAGSITQDSGAKGELLDTDFGVRCIPSLKYFYPFPAESFYLV